MCSHAHVCVDDYGSQRCLIPLELDIVFVSRLMWC